MDRKKPEEVITYMDCGCGYEVEIWFDETKAKCPECDEYVFRKEEDLLKDFKCASWCDSAEECLGPKTYQRFQEIKRKQSEKSKGDLETKLDPE